MTLDLKSEYVIRIVITMILLVGIYFTPSELIGDDSVSLDYLLDVGQRQNLSLQQRRLDLKIDPFAVRAAWGQFLPTVTVGYNIDQSSFYNPTYLNPDGTVATFPRHDTLQIAPGLDTVIYRPVPEGKRRNSSVFVRLDETLFDGGRNYYNLKNTRLSTLRRDLALVEEEMQLRNQITRSFTVSVAASRGLKLAAVVVEQRQLQLRTAKARLEAGTVIRRDVLQAEVDLGRAQNDSLQAALDSERALEQLNLSVGLPVDTIYIHAELPGVFFPPWKADVLLKIVLENRGDLKNSKVTVDIEKNNLNSATGAYLPSITGTIIHSRSEQSGVNIGFTLNPRNRYTSYGLTVSWQMFDRFTRGLKRQEAKLKYRKAVIGRELLLQQIRQQVNDALGRLKLLYNQAQVATKTSKLAEETLHIEQTRYQLGSASLIELGIAQLSFESAKSEQIRIETEFYTALGELEYYVGAELR